MAATYRVAMIGCGNRARHHGIGLVADPRCEVVALADIKPEAAEKLNREFDFGASLYTDYHAMLATEKPDVVVGCLWTPLHLPVFRDCARAGVRAYLSEKPMAPTWGGCLEMARIAHETGCQLTFCHQRRFSPANLLARQLIEDGVFGDIDRMDLYSPPHLMDCGTHTFDQALMFNEEAPARWVLGALDLSAPIRYFDVPAETMATGTVVFDNGVRAALQVGGPDMDIWGGVRITGSNGFLELYWAGKCRRAVVYDKPDWVMPVESDSEDEAMRGVVRNAIDSLEQGVEPVLSWKKALRASEIIYALYESARRRKRIELPLTIRDHPIDTLLGA